MSAVVALPFTVGARTVWRVKRRLVRRPFGLAETLSGELPHLPPLARDAHGYLVTSLPAALADPLLAGSPALKPFVRQRYARHYLSLEGGFDAYMATFSAKTRSTLKRKRKKMEERSGGALDLRCYRTPDEMADFYAHARAVSATTYQERLLNAGLPEGDEALARMRDLASRDAIRGWILFVEGRPISYLHAPAEGDTLIYAHLGYDPEFADFSPGTVLQLDAVRQLMEEGRFRFFDFTEGEGQHKSRFATGAVECIDLLLLRPTIGNIAAARALIGFDAAVAGAKLAAAKFGIEKVARSLLR